MSTTLVPTPSTTSLILSVAGSAVLRPSDSCISLASNLRCYYSTHGKQDYHTPLIIPVALEVIFTSSLLFTNRRSGRRHLFLVAEGFLDFLLALLEVLAFRIPAVRSNISHFKAIDKAIGALSFTPLLLLMSFLYAWVRTECLPIAPTRVQRIARLLLFMLIPAVITVNTIASFVGISYEQGPVHVITTFAKQPESFVIWIFFTSLTLALLALFQASCFCFAFCRLIRAVLTQRSIETTSKDAAVMFKGIGWMNGGIILGAIETLVGFVFYGIAIAYVRRVLRLFSMALLCIGVAKGIDEVEDFGRIRNELEKSNTVDRNFRRSKLRELISNPRLSTFRQLSPTATAFHARPRAPLVSSQDFAYTLHPHPYATGGLPDMESSKVARTPPSPATAGQNVDLPDASPRPSLQNGLPGMSEFAHVKEKRMSKRPRRWVTIYYNRGTPTLHLRLSAFNMSPPVDIAGSNKNRWMGNVPKANKKPLLQTPVKEQSRFSTSSESSIKPETVSIYPASTTHRDTGESEINGEISNDSYSRHYPMGSSSSTTATRGHGHVRSNKDISTTAAHLNSTRRFSGFSDASGLSAAQAEIVDTPRRKLSFKRGKSALAKAVLYPIPGKNVAMALAGNEDEEAAAPPGAIRKLPPLPKAPAKSTLPINQRPSNLSSVPIQYPTLPPTSLSRPPQKRQSIVDDDGSVVTVMAVSPVEAESESGEKRGTRKESGYSIRSIHEALQAVREMADKFPDLPPGAVGVAGQMGDETPHSRRQRPLTTWSTDTEDFMRTRIPKEKKMKGRAVSVARSSFMSGQEIQQLPPAFKPQKNTPRERRRLVSQQLPPLLPRSTANPTDIFFDNGGTTDHSGSNQLSPLAMSIKLRHPQSLVSTLNARPTVASPISPVSDTGDVIDFGTALKEWRTNSGVKSSSIRAMGDLSSIVGSARKTRNHQATEQEKRYSIISSVTLDEIPEQLEQTRRPRDAAVGVRGNEGGPLTRIKSIGSAPRRVRPQPITDHTTRGSLHLQPLVIPLESSLTRE
ncbi:hypothetical protein AGABI2DRAFT_121212 [Agaricus bisporus var. bisporus H97]|uniref:hypothetical protein n=1 Tax=Agaricus bisporus var. bisporus (strain H97 / ATCC MYA-4626 / FGSC 10389) TaxID=936046 RepID=UPI00029F767E|nr:hypothetical protein AGABI2DRAFT_121212 [Agaricus bisporus var. bisporus H97]EKV44016.1 hypothetical protein AGABI2DRAFT_121212 [Agaricus bisporus var. bisporus H97]